MIRNTPFPLGLNAVQTGLRPLHSESDDPAEQPSVASTHDYSSGGDGARRPDRYERTEKSEVAIAEEI